MRLRAVELRRVALTLRTRFTTSSGIEHDRDILLVRAFTDAGEGWGECCALSAPLYTSEYVDGAHAVLRDHLLPRLLAAGEVPAAGVAPLLRPVRGHRMAKAAIEMAVLDAELRASGTSFARRLGGVRASVDCGVSIGIPDGVPALLREVEGYLADGYRRIKLKIEPGWDVEPVRAVREAFGPDLLLQVDANSAYTLADVPRLQALDEHGLLLIEQPLPEEQLRAHAELAAQLATPVCLDESIVSAQSAADAIALGACSIVNVKPARVGGYLEALRVHDVCQAGGVPVWCGGMLETGLGRAGNVALASLPGFTLPGDLSASDRYYAEDLTEPFRLEEGRLRVPSGPGLGVSVDGARLARATTTVERIGA
ncbi:MAG: o-succinylbenzoate synthase [Candidatus Dormiibacterota bacterium]